MTTRERSVKYLTYVLRNARRNCVRSCLTIGSTAICVLLMMILLTFFSIQDDTNSGWRIRDRIVTLNANGFAGMVPITYVDEIAGFEGVVVCTPVFWFGGTYHEEVMPFAQFAVDPLRIFAVRDEFTIAADQLKAFQDHKDGCVIGRKLAQERGFKIGDGLPLKGDLYPVDMDLTIRGIYNGPDDADLRQCLFRWDYFDDAMKRIVLPYEPGSPRAALQERMSGNAGMIFIKCKSAEAMPVLSRRIDDLYRNSDYPTRTETEEVFGKMFFDLLGDLKGVVRSVSLAMFFAVLCVNGNTMMMSMRERTSEVAVLKAIGFDKGRVLFLVITEAVLLAGIGGILGTIGCKGLCELVDISRVQRRLSALFLHSLARRWSADRVYSARRGFRACRYCLGHACG